MSSGQRVTTQQLHSEMREGFGQMDKRLSALERDVQGNNGEGLWDVLKGIRAEIRKLWVEVTAMKESAAEHHGEHDGTQAAKAARKAANETRRRNVEVWIVGGALLVLQVLESTGVL